MWERFLAALRDLPHAKSDDQTAIGRAVGVRQTMVSAYKTGDKGPSMSAAIALAAYADICVEYLLTGKGPIRRWAEMDEQFQHLVQYWERLNDANRGKLLEQAELLFTVQAKHRTPRHLPQRGESPVTPPISGKKSSH